MDATYRRAFGQALKEVRTERAMTQQDLDFASGIHRTTISQWERGVYLPSFKNFLALCEGLEVAPSELLRLTELKIASLKRKRRPLPPPPRGRPRRKPG